MSYSGKESGQRYNIKHKVVKLYQGRPSHVQTSKHQSSRSDLPSVWDPREGLRETGAHGS